jgi:hypothetical protein
MLTEVRSWPAAADWKRVRGDALYTWVTWQPAGTIRERTDSYDIVG